MITEGSSDYPDSRTITLSYDISLFFSLSQSLRILNRHHFQVFGRRKETITRDSTDSQTLKVQESENWLNPEFWTRISLDTFQACSAPCRLNGRYFKNNMIICRTCQMKHGSVECGLIRSWRLNTVNIRGLNIQISINLQSPNPCFNRHQGVNLTKSKW